MKFFLQNQKQSEYQSSIVIFLNHYFPQTKSINNFSRYEITFLSALFFCSQQSQMYASQYQNNYHRHKKQQQQQFNYTQPTCLGCKRYFTRRQKLPLQSMTIEFKNYEFPIKGSMLKQILLKTIVGFMNSKGGTIYIGVDDASGQVVGVRLNRKQMDQFRLMVKQMLDKVKPSVDLIKSQQVSVDFIPVLEEKSQSFGGKYVVKFIVLQGNPSRLYCISEKIAFSSSPNDKNSEQGFQVISAFRRHNLGGVEQIKGIRVIQQIYEKATNPYKVAKTFHEGCNPHPIIPKLTQKVKQQPKIFVEENQNEENFVFVKKSLGSKEQTQYKTPKTSKQAQRQQNQAPINNQISKNPPQNKAPQTPKNPNNDSNPPNLQKNKPSKDPTTNSQKNSSAHSNSVFNSKKPEHDPSFFSSIQISNILPTSLKSLINYLRIQTCLARQALSTKINEINKQTIQIKFEKKIHKQTFQKQIYNPPILSTLNSFGINKRILIDFGGKKKYEEKNKQSNNNNSNNNYQSHIESKQSNIESKKDTKPYYYIFIQNYSTKCEQNLVNYLTKSISPKYQRKILKRQAFLKVIFQNKSDMNEFFFVLKKKEHQKQLNSYCDKKDEKIKITIWSDGNESQNPKKENSNNEPKVNEKKKYSEKKQIQKKASSNSNTNQAQNQPSNSKSQQKCYQIEFSNYKQKCQQKLMNHLNNSISSKIQRTFKKIEMGRFKIILQNQQDWNKVYLILNEQTFQNVFASFGQEGGQKVKVIARIV